MRCGPLAALVLGAVLVGLSLAPSVRAQGTPTINQIIDFHVSAVDTNGNGKIDALVGTFNATVTVAGNFRFAAALATGFGYVIITNNTDVNLAVGTHPLSVSVPGPWVYQSGFSGPYDFRLSVIAVTDQGYWVSYGFIPVDVYTPAYNATDFEAPWAYIGSPITDAGVDSDGDGLYNALVVHVPIVVNRTTYVQVQGYFGSPYYYSASSLPTEPLLLTQGTHDLDLTWDGMRLRSSTSIVSGPLTVSLQLSLPQLLSGYYDPPIARATYVTTHSYASNQFERPSAYFSSTSAPTTAEDTNGNGLTDLLVFHVPITVRVEGDYGVSVMVSGSTGLGGGLPQGAKIVHLLAGNTTVDVPVSGIALSRVATYNPQAGAIVSRLSTSSYSDQDQIQWALPNFQPSSFESRSVSTLTVYTVPTNASCGNVYVWDPANRFIAFTYVYYGYSGSLTLSLYDGTFYVVAIGCGSSLGVAARKVTVSGATTVVMNVTASGTLHEDIQVSVPSWNSTDIRMSADMGGASALYRLIADFYGNADGSADTTELNNVAKILALGYGYVGYYGLAREDNRSLSFLSRFTASMTGAGEITSTTQLSYAIEYLAYTANAPIPGDHHRLVVDVPYSPVGGTIKVSVSLGASVGGNLSMVSRLMVYDGDGFTWPANATATRTGPQSWSLAVGQIPPNEPMGVQLELVVDGYGTPVPVSPSLLDYLANPLAVVLIIVVVAVAAFALMTRRKKGPAPPTPPAT